MPLPLTGQSGENRPLPHGFRCAPTRGYSQRPRWGRSVTEMLEKLQSPNIDPLSPYWGRSMLKSKIVLAVLVLAIGFAILDSPTQDLFDPGMRQSFTEYSSIFSQLAGGILLFIGGWCFLLQNRGMGFFFLGLATFFLVKGMPHDMMVPP